MVYFVMACHGVFPSAALDGPDRFDPPWISGRPLREPITEPLVYTLDPERPGNIPVMFDSTSYPIMRDDLVEALKSVGVDNLELFDARVIDPTTGHEHRNYRAYNVVGLVAAADLSRSRLDETQAASGLRLFRLAERIEAIGVDEIVRAEVERRNIEGMLFYDLADWVTLPRGSEP